MHTLNVVAREIFAAIGLAFVLFLLACRLVPAETADVYDGSGNFAGQIVTDDGVVNTYDSAGDYTGQIVLPDSGGDDGNDD